MHTGEDTVTREADAGTDWTAVATQLLGDVDRRVMTAVARIDPETPLGVSFDAR